MISELIALPYELARKPLAAADARLSDKLPDSIGARVGWALGTTDKLAGTLLHNPDIAQRGAERVERSGKRLTAAGLEAEAQARREQARETQKAGREEAARKRQEAQQTAASGLDEADEVEARRTKEAEERAAKAAADKKAKADKRAAERKSAAESHKEQTDSAAQAKQKAAQRKAKAELDDAREDEQAAGVTRADADRLEQLAAAKKQERKED